MDMLVEIAECLEEDTGPIKFWDWEAPPAGRIAYLSTIGGLNG
jgi:hypothetical protein